MSNLLSRRMVGIATLAFATVLATSFSGTEAYAQQPCTTSNTAIAQAILDLEAQGATVTCDDHNLYATFPNGLFFNLVVPDDGAIRLYTFDPASGRSIYFYIVGTTLYIQDSIHGFINAGDGWFSIFYPVGNPFDASIQNPMQVLFQQNLPPEFQGGYSGEKPRPPYEPIRD